MMEGKRKYTRIKIHQCRGKRSDSSDSSGRLPTPDEFGFEDLNEATRIYNEYVTDNPGKKIPLQIFMDRFNCSAIKAQIFKAAAEFKYRLMSKGLA